MRWLNRIIHNFVGREKRSGLDRRHGGFDLAYIIAVRRRMIRRGVDRDVGTIEDYGFALPPPVTINSTDPLWEKRPRERFGGPHPA